MLGVMVAEHTKSLEASWARDPEAALRNSLGLALSVWHQPAKVWHSLPSSQLGVHPAQFEALQALET